MVDRIGLRPRKCELVTRPCERPDHADNDPGIEDLRLAAFLSAREPHLTPWEGR